MKTRVVLLTAGLSPGNFNAAAKRIATMAKTLFDFEEIFVLDSGNIDMFCPEVKSRYGAMLDEDVKGFGYWAWKPEFILRVLSGSFGDFDQVVWLDAGCEIYSNAVTRARFRRRIKVTSESGYWLQALKNSDLEYSKRSVISQFPNLHIHELAGPQIQANYLHLQGEIGMRVAEAWFANTVRKIENLDLECNKEFEHEKFIEHRSDQSILSLVCKSMNLKYSKLNIPAGHSARSVFRGLSEPIWISRNRTGVSIVPQILKRIR